MLDAETDWVASRRPVTPPPGGERTAVARRSLLEHIAAEPVAPTRLPERRRWITVLAPATALAVVAIFVVGTDGDGSGAGPTGVASAEALPRLVDQLRDEPQFGSGDGTLVVREQSYPGTEKDPVVVYDLYADDGKYFFSQERSGLAAAIAAGPKRDSGSLGREIAAAADAIRGDIDEARTRMIDSVLRPGQEYEPAAEEQINDPEWQDSWVWGNSIDALVGGAGRSDVRAGVLRLLGSVDSVEVTDVSIDGRPALQITNDFLPGAYAETLTVDAETGEPIRFVGGVRGEDESVIDYRVSRVTLDRL